MAKEIFMVANSGQEGYLYSPMFFINGTEAARKVGYWESIGDRACLVIYRVNNDVYNILQEEYKGRCSSGEMSELEFDYGFEAQKEDAEEPETEEQDDEDLEEEEADLFQQMGLETESMGALLGKVLNIQRR